MSDSGGTSTADSTAITQLWPPALHEHNGLTDAELLAAYAPPAGASLRMNFVTSTDGAVAVGGVSAPLSSESDHRVFRILRDLSDAIMVGAGTARMEGYGAVQLPEKRRAQRRAVSLAPNPTLIVVSSDLQLDPSSELFTATPTRPIVITHDQAPVARRKALSRVADVLVTGEASVDFSSAITALAARGLNHVLCEGGPHLFGTLAATDLVDELCLTLSPLLAGPGAGRIIAGRPHLAMPRTLHLVHLLHSAGNLFLRYSSQLKSGEPSP